MVIFFLAYIKNQAFRVSLQATENFPWGLNKNNAHRITHNHWKYIQIPGHIYGNNFYVLNKTLSAIITYPTKESKQKSTSICNQKTKVSQVLGLYSD